MQGNFGFASTLLDTLKRCGNTCPVMLSSSIQATLIGRYGESDYGKSKLAGENLFSTTAKKPGPKCLSTVSLICSANGVVRTIILQLLHSATTLPMICQYR